MQEQHSLPLQQVQELPFSNFLGYRYSASEFHTLQSVQKKLALVTPS